MTPQQKLSRLKKIISDMGSCLVAFSGGVDSCFLLKAVSDALPAHKLLAVTADSPTYPRVELLFAREFAAGLGVKHKIIRTAELKDKRFYSNPVNRCYFCKKELFSKLKRLALRRGLDFVLDASSTSDRGDFRPGAAAAKELGVRSPLQEAGLGKDEIRILSKARGLMSWDKPALACLASRIPYGTRITTRLLRRINRAEDIIRRAGFRQVRARDYRDTCRIEVPQRDLPRLVARRGQIIDKLKKIGYNYVALDLEGYRPGSMNPVRKRGKAR